MANYLVKELLNCYSIRECFEWLLEDTTYRMINYCHTTRIWLDGYFFNVDDEDNYIVSHSEELETSLLIDMICSNKTECGELWDMIKEDTINDIIDMYYTQNPSKLEEFKQDLLTAWVTE